MRRLVRQGDCPRTDQLGDLPNTTLRALDDDLAGVAPDARRRRAVLKIDLQPLLDLGLGVQVLRRYGWEIGLATHIA